MISPVRFARRRRGFGDFGLSGRPVLPPTLRRRRERGATLLEALFAFVVLALGTLAAGHLQGQLTLAGEIGRARAAAVRVGSEAIEDMRSYAAVGAASGVRSYAAIGNGAVDVAAPAGDRGGASFRVVRRIDEAQFAQAKAATVEVGWRDRSGVARAVVLHSFIAAVDPAYGGSLAIDAGAVAEIAAGAFGRARTIPIAAKTLGGGRSVWKPAAAGDIALVFDDASGEVVERCGGVAAATRDVTAADLVRCTRGRWLSIGGIVRFGSSPSALASAARDLPMPTAIRLVLADGPYPTAPECVVEAQRAIRDDAPGRPRFDAVALGVTTAASGAATPASPAATGASGAATGASGAATGGSDTMVGWTGAASAPSGAPSAASGAAPTDTGDRFTAWHCLVAPRADGRWSGRVELEPIGWTIGTASADRRVCRYVEDADRSGAIDGNIEHPRDYVDVAGALVAQNFLVVPGDAGCPAPWSPRLASARSRTSDDPATEPHQP